MPAENSREENGITGGWVCWSVENLQMESRLVCIWMVFVVVSVTSVPFASEVEVISNGLVSISRSFLSRLS